MKKIAFSLDVLRAAQNSVRVMLNETTRVHVPATRDALNERFQAGVEWYQRVVGTQELRRFQDRVTELQEELLKAQETRRQVGFELADVRRQADVVQEQLRKVKRHENLQMFLDLMKEETELLKREQVIQRAFGEQDQFEREIFTAFTNAIQKAHEKQRAQVENTKYLGIIISFVGSFLSFLYTSMRNKDMRREIEMNMHRGFEPIELKMGNNEKTLIDMIEGIRTDVKGLAKETVVLSTSIIPKPEPAVSQTPIIKQPVHEQDLWWWVKVISFTSLCLYCLNKT